ncbi:YicC/YloC family endoribonuclease [Aliiroseovarius marinus]|uniref:YicC/YloC family endoribonuclease n=1 Tax=Aliiroseovarius marinus TaxID=2500159 RepID=UPI003D7E9957
MPNSMTGYASATGALEGFSWTWDLRAVNARGLDLRLRLPDWIEGLEDATRKALKAKVARGNVSLSLKLTRADVTGMPSLNPDALARALAQLSSVAAEAKAQGLPVAPISPADIAQMRGVIDVDSAAEVDHAPLARALIAQLPELVSAFCDARAEEGAAMGRVLSGQVDEVERLVAEAEALLSDRDTAQATALREALARVMDNTDGADPDRVAQELAVIAVKTDVREELDRLAAHIAAARSLLAAEGAIGRKFDFLMQEFNREANTLCSKAQFNALTAIGLDLKHVIDQMREQVQNVE